MKDKKEIQEFIENHVALVKPLSKEANIAYFDAITTGKPELYKKAEELQIEIEKIYNDKKGFENIKRFNEQKISNKLLRRQVEHLYRSFLGSQGDIELIKKIIELSTKLENQFNSYRANINGRELTDNEIKDILKSETDNSKLKEAWEASKKQGEIVEKELVELIKLRNKLAVSLGFKNYYYMSLELSEQNPDDIFRIFRKLDKLTKKPFKNLKNEVDEILKRRYNVNKLMPWHYQDLFFQEGPEIYKVDLDAYYKNQDIMKIAEDFYENLGMSITPVLAKSDLYEKPGKYQHACCIDIDREGDVRIVQNIKDNEKWMGTTLHELGHAAYDLYTDKNVPYLLKHPYIFATEAIAMYFERNSLDTEFIKKYTSNKTIENEPLIKEELKKTLRLTKLVFSRWSQVMLNFEKSIYENPEQDLNKLCWKLVKKYQLINFTREKPDWASKIHIVSSPCYYHNYLLGELFASQLNNRMKTKSLIGKNVGDFLKNNLFKYGKVLPWKKLVKTATGENLNPEYYAKEFC